MWFSAWNLRILRFWHRVLQIPRDYSALERVLAASWGGGEIKGSCCLVPGIMVEVVWNLYTYCSPQKEPNPNFKA